MKKILYSIIAIYIISLYTCISCNFAPGSYPYVELYEFQVSEEFLIKAVKEFKDENPQYCLPEHERFIDGRKKEGDQWYHIWFYYPQENQVIKCWVRTSNKGNAELGFIGIGNGLTLSDYKEINKDFSNEINRLQKEKFERYILNKIKKKIQ